MSVGSAKDFPDTDSQIPKDCTAHDKQTILEDALQIGQRWLAVLAEDHPQRPLVTQVARMAEDLARNPDAPPVAMSNLRALMCSSCRRLEAAKGQCSGRPLDQCFLRSQAI
ncbi:MAG: hypothetical protein K9K30_12670 [Burkholderiaceae bacterium]|nr:hypothetical protein [Sulfuritalea sp.]MCF8176085.1 hypothetical protein [Burkholderiaceae bacterium]